MARSSRRGQRVVGAGVVVGAEAVDHSRARLVEPDNLDAGALAAELQHRLVERGDRRDVPTLRAADVDGHRVDHLLDVAGREEHLHRGKEYLAGDYVGPSVTALGKSAQDREQPAHLAGEEDTT